MQSPYLELQLPLKFPCTPESASKTDERAKSLRSNMENHVMLTWSKRVEQTNNFLAEMAARQHAFMNELLRKANRPEREPDRPVEGNTGESVTFGAEIGESNQAELETAVAEVWSKARSMKWRPPILPVAGRFSSSM